MEEQYKLIEGTLARTSERKGTILYKQAKKRDEEKRLLQLGIRSLPTVPSEVDDVKVIKYVLFQLNKEIGELKGLLTNHSRMNLEKDGEAHVRAVNDKLNKLLRRKADWDRRICEIDGKKTSFFFPKRKQFFGCAKELPEALGGEESIHERNSDEHSEVEDLLPSSSGEEPDDERDGGEPQLVSERYSFFVEKLSLRDNVLLSEESAAEKKFRKESCSNQFIRDPEFVTSFAENGKDCIPSEDERKLVLTEKRRKSLLSRLEKLKS